jgi:putative addiction module killer protein
VEVVPRKLYLFQLADGRVPFIDWLHGLRDRQAVQRIQVRIDRLSLGNIGDARAVGAGVHELKVNYGPGYRVYFGIVDTKIVLLLCGGDKSSQSKDVLTAKEYWNAYKEAKQGKGNSLRTVPIKRS